MTQIYATNRHAGFGSIVTDVALAYNSFGQFVSDAQSHSGAVVPGTTPQVQYAYADGSSNTIRPTTLTYPNGRVVTISYGSVGSINDSLSRVDGLIDGSTTLVNYSYLGMSVPVQTTYPQPGIQYTLLGSSSGTSPAGDIYWGLDLFGRIIDSRWYNTSTSADVDRIKYGYDRVSNRIWRQNPVATAAGAAFDEFYTNDGLQRLKDMQRGTLNGTNTGITSPTFKQCWTLDPTGNWSGFNESTNGSTWTLNQTRTSNPVNEITNIGTTTGTEWAIPVYDAAGNMTNIPITSGPLTSMGWADLTVDQWSALSVDDWNTLPLAGTTDSYTATYDAWNRLVKLVTLSTGNIVQQNQYDARTFRTVIQTYTSGVLSETRHSYFSAGWRCLEERTGTSTTPERQFVWGNRYIDDLVCRNRTSETLYAMQDANWNVTSVADATAAVQERYAYAAYGTPTYLTPAFTARSTSSYAWETLACGYRYHEGTRFYLIRFRMYKPDVGSWCQRDPIGYVDAANLYFTSAMLNSVDIYGLEISDSFNASNEGYSTHTFFDAMIGCKAENDPMSTAQEYIEQLLDLVDNKDCFEFTPHYVTPGKPPVLTEVANDFAKKVSDSNLPVVAIYLGHSNQADDLKTFDAALMTIKGKGSVAKMQVNACNADGYNAALQDNKVYLKGGSTTAEGTTLDDLMKELSDNISVVVNELNDLCEKSGCKGDLGNKKRVKVHMYFGKMGIKNPYLNAKEQGQLRSRPDQRNYTFNNWKR